MIKSYERANHPDGFKRLMLAMASEKSRTEKLKQLQCPLLVIHGDADPLFSVEHAKHLASCVVGSHLEIIEKMGHAMPRELCGEIVRIICFS